MAGSLLIAPDLVSQEIPLWVRVGLRAAASPGTADMHMSDLLGSTPEIALGLIQYGYFCITVGFGWEFTCTAGRWQEAAVAGDASSSESHIARQDCPPARACAWPCPAPNP